MSERFEVFIPLLPPGINQTYGIGKTKKGRHLYKRKEAKDWQEGASVIIGAEAGKQGFTPSDRMGLNILLYQCNHDIDALIKLIIDTLAEKLNFNDKKILILLVKKFTPKDYPNLAKGVNLCLYKIN